MNIILMGAPGSGKGTQARVLEEDYGIIQVSTGDLFRANIKNKTELGVKVKELIDAGNLVPDELTVAMLEDRISQDDCRAGFILDGFPRTVAQAEVLDTMLDDKGMKLDSVILIEVPDDFLVKRITGRFTCAACGEGYHDEFKKPAIENICDNCGAKDSFNRRADDNEESVKIRLEAYHNQTAPILPFYEERGMLKRVDGTKSMNEVTAQIKAILS